MFRKDDSKEIFRMTGENLSVGGSVTSDRKDHGAIEIS